MWVAMSAAEREEFLAGVHVGVLSAAIGRSGCARSTGSARTRAKHKPKGSATPRHQPMRRNAGYAPLPL
jgi:hypothetical protein